MSLFQRLAKVLLGGALLAGAFAAVFFFAAASPPPTPRISEAYDPAAEHPQRLSIHDPRLQRVLRLMLNSDRLWQSLDVRARYTEYAYQANPQAPTAPDTAQGKTTFIEEIHIRKPWAVTYRQFLEGQSKPRYQVAWQANATQTGRRDDQASADRFQRELAWLPRTLDAVQPGYVIDHPLVRLIPARAMDMLFPTWLAQQATTGKALVYQGQATLFGRTVSRIRLDEGGGAVVTAWVDDQTGILLRFRKEVAGKLLAAYEVEALEIR